MMKKTVLLALTLVACGTIEEFPEYQSDKSVPPIDNKVSVIYAGDICSEGCIWSSYAVAFGAQDAEVQCGSTSCACVVEGNIYESCTHQQETEVFVEEAQDTRVSQSSNSELPYFYQYDNYINPGSTCQNTSIAMLLAKYGWQGVPDDITREWGKDYAQSPQRLANVFNTIAQREGIRARIEPVLYGTLEELQRLLREGKPTIIHGYFTGYGHVLVATGFDGNSYTTNDPAGRWSERFMGGYLGTGSGRGVRYGKSAFEAAVATSDGYTHLPLWYHRLVE